MTGLLPHTSVIRGDVENYIGDVLDKLVANAASLKHSAAFRNLYKCTLAADCLVSKLGHRLRPAPPTIRGVLQQLPVMAAVSGESTYEVQLRRLIECVVWAVYFTDHPVEWSEFESNPGRRIQKDLTKPITFAAHREPSYYRNYAKELMEAEPSGLTVKAVDDLARDFAMLSASAHGGSAVRKGRLHAPIAAFNENELARLAKTSRAILANCCIVLAAFQPRRFNGLPPVHRAWFDWLIGTQRNRVLRSGPFGLI